MQTRKLAEYVSNANIALLDPETTENAKMSLADYIGVSISGAKTPAAKILTEYFYTGDTSEADILVYPFSKTRAEYAAAINAACGHALDFDDVHNASITHLGAMSIPAALAIAQREHANGKDLLLAVAMAYEVGARIGEALVPSSYRFWHTTAVVGPFCSAAATAVLLKLNAKQTANAFGSAGTQAGGLWAFLSSGAMSKLLHVSNSALCGIRSAQLAAKGFTGAQDVLESDRGFVLALAPGKTADDIDTDFSKPLRINQNSFKPYPCCRHTHSANFAILELASKLKLNAADIVSIDDYTYRTAVELTDNSAPQNPYAAKFSLQFCIAAALLYGSLGEKVFCQESLSDPKLLELMSKIKVHVSEDAQNCQQSDPSQWYHKIVVNTTTKTEHSLVCVYPYGDSNNPMGWPGIKDKFMDNTEAILGHDKAEQLFERIRSVDTLQDAALLFAD